MEFKTSPLSLKLEKEWSSQKVGSTLAISKLILRSFFCFLFLNMLSFGLLAQTDKPEKQKLTKVKGIVIDADTKEPLPFVNVFFDGGSAGTTTDFDGKYAMSSQWATENLTASFVGYDDVTQPVVLGKNQTIDFELSSGSTLQEVVVKEKKRQRYRKRNNPAID